ncbi:MAG: hypothetical protein GY865_15895, partial [candidate division Zixibacteria bacterium]|nr:hypothetical protein [candidate division Zixibacteria bacterium]
MKSECNNNKFKEMLFAYELGMLDEKANEEMELHLLECESCNLDVQELIQQSDILRHNPEMRKMVGNLAEEKNNFIKEEIKVSKEPFLNRFWKSYAPTMALVAVILVVLIIKPWDIQIRTNLEAFAARNSIVVLYFENLTGNNEDNQLGKIAANLLITDLAESQYLRVVSGQRLNDLLNHLDTLESQIGFPTQIALETDARWVIKGSILQSEPNIVLTAQLINIETGFVEASHRVEGGEGEDIFTSIDQLTKGIRNDLNLPSIVNEEPDKQVTDITTNSPEAYHHYLEGIRKSSEFYLPEASESFAKALQFDSTFAMVYYYLSLSANRNDRIDFISKAVEYSENASRKEKYFIESREAFINGDIESAVQVLNELLQYYPDEKDAYYFLGRYEKNRGNIGKCITYYNKAIEIDPWYKSAVNELAYTYNEIGSFNEA